QGDSDGDGLADGLEAGIINPYPASAECLGLQTAGSNFAGIGAMQLLNPDSDNDGLPDGAEDANHNGWLDPGETDPSVADTDGDGLGDYLEVTGETTVVPTARKGPTRRQAAGSLRHGTGNSRDAGGSNRRRAGPVGRGPRPPAAAPAARRRNFTADG
ncbi:MAG: hypothetical protein HYV03_02760, partial [Deltaproteobacteria bacterium]|nr:hypothetical protein [Deltaproteobacteria bacterium]